MRKQNIGQTNDESVSKQDEISELQTLVQDNSSYAWTQDWTSKSEDDHKGDDGDFGRIDGCKVK